MVTGTTWRWRLQTCRDPWVPRSLPAALPGHGHGDVVVIDQPAVVCERAQHVGARIAERRTDGPLVARRNRRRAPPGGPWRVSTVTMILPDLRLRRIEGHLSRPSVNEPRQP